VRPPLGRRIGQRRPGRRRIDADSAAAALPCQLLGDGLLDLRREFRRLDEGLTDAGRTANEYAHAAPVAIGHGDRDAVAEILWRVAPDPGEHAGDFGRLLVEVAQGAENEGATIVQKPAEPRRVVLRSGEFNKAWRSACRKAGYTGTLLHLRRSGVRAMVRSGTPESVAMKISGHATAAVFKRYDITSDQDLKDARDRRAQFGHNQAARVISLNRQVANK
jgi:hypothetical protein